MSDLTTNKLFPFLTAAQQEFLVLYDDSKDYLKAAGNDANKLRKLLDDENVARLVDWINGEYVPSEKDYIVALWRIGTKRKDVTPNAKVAALTAGAEIQGFLGSKKTSNDSNLADIMAAVDKQHKE